MIIYERLGEGQKSLFGSLCTFATLLDTFISPI